MTEERTEIPQTRLETLDACIIGGGFAGMNAARILSGKNLKCRIFTSGSGSSRFWAGTVDFLNYDAITLEAAFTQFKNVVPSHPYTLLKFEETQLALLEFFRAFPQFIAFREGGSLTNQPILTTLGTLKPCVATWASVFHDFTAFKQETLAILVEFREFNNSVMHLVAKGLGDNFEGKFRVLQLSFTELMDKCGLAKKLPANPKKLTENQIAQAFDAAIDHLDSIVDYVRAGIQAQIQSQTLLPIACILFPPVLGIVNTKKILEKLTEKLETRVGELLAFSPSLMSQRFINLFEETLKKLNVNILKGHTLISLQKEATKDKGTWFCQFVDATGVQNTILAKYVIFATGSLFHVGCVESVESLQTTLKRYAIPVPNSLTSNFELVAEHPLRSPGTGLFTCGSASYIIKGETTDEEEIRFGTGLGLAIVTSAKVANEICLRESRAKPETAPKSAKKIV